MLLNVLVALIGVGVAGLMGYWAQDRTPPVRIEKIEVVTPMVPPGAAVKVRYQVYRERSCHVIVEQMVYDSERVRVGAQDEDFTAAPGDPGTDVFSLAVPVPYNAAEGVATYRSVRSYFCNPIHYWFYWPIIVRTPDLSFEVVSNRSAITNGAR